LALVNIARRLKYRRKFTVPARTYLQRTFTDGNAHGQRDRYNRNRWVLLLPYPRGNYVPRERYSAAEPPREYSISNLAVQIRKRFTSLIGRGDWIFGTHPSWPWPRVVRREPATGEITRKIGAVRWRYNSRWPIFQEAVDPPIYTHMRGGGERAFSAA